MSDFLNPNKVLQELDLREDMIAVEFGCGSGAFTIALAKNLPDGRVYALDIQADVLSVLQGRARAGRVPNIETILCDLEDEHGSTLPNDFVDLVLIPNILFQTEDKKSIIKEAKRILKKQGKLLIIDWKKEKGLGPKKGRISANEVKAIAQELGMKLEKQFEPGTYHYGLIFNRIE